MTAKIATAVISNVVLLHLNTGKTVRALIYSECRLVGACVRACLFVCLCACVRVCVRQCHCHSVCVCVCHSVCMCVE